MTSAALLALYGVDGGGSGSGGGRTAVRRTPPPRHSRYGLIGRHGGDVDGFASVRLDVYFCLFVERCSGAPVDLFVFTAPSWRCSSLFNVDCHHRAVAGGASKDSGERKDSLALKN